MSIKKGDIVGRKSYGKDVFFGRSKDKSDKEIIFLEGRVKKLHRL